MQMMADKLEALLEPTITSLGFELWGLEYLSQGTRGHLRIFIDKKGGITLQDCSKVSHQLSGILEVEDPIDVNFRLEISSPGIERPLLKIEHYKLYIGEPVKVRLKWVVDGRRNFRGSIAACSDSAVEFLIDNEPFQVAFDAIKKARLLWDQS